LIDDTYEESVAFSGSISMELDSEGPLSQLALNTYQLISDIIFLYQLAQAGPCNVLANVLCTQ